MTNICSYTENISLSHGELSVYLQLQMSTVSFQVSRKSHVTEIACRPFWNTWPSGHLSTLTWPVSARMVWKSTPCGKYNGGQRFSGTNKYIHIHILAVNFISNRQYPEIKINTSLNKIQHHWLLSEATREAHGIIQLVAWKFTCSSGNPVLSSWGLK